MPAIRVSDLRDLPSFLVKVFDNAGPVRRQLPVIRTYPSLLESQNELRSGEIAPESTTFLDPSKGPHDSPDVQSLSIPSGLPSSVPVVERVDLSEYRVPIHELRVLVENGPAPHGIPGSPRFVSAGEMKYPRMNVAVGVELAVI